MSTDPGVWDPSKKTTEPAEPVLNRFVEVMRNAGEDLTEALAPNEVTDNAGLMQLDASAWSVLERLETDDLELLARFFTLAEMQLAGWDGGKRSPVIYIVAELRRRDAFAAELRKWIKRHTDNRYLPYGSAL